MQGEEQLISLMYETVKKIMKEYLKGKEAE